MRPYEQLPQGLQGGMKRYIEGYILPGSFLTAVLENDLREACERADVDNETQLFNIILWLNTYAPCSCWGSIEKVREWNQKRED